MCGLTLAIHPKRDPHSIVSCVGCGEPYALCKGTMVRGDVIVDKVSYFGFLPFCSLKCLLLHHPVLGHC